MYFTLTISRMVRWSKKNGGWEPPPGAVYSDEEELGKQTQEGTSSHGYGFRAVTAPVSFQVQISSISFVRISMQKY